MTSDRDEYSPEQESASHRTSDALASHGERIRALEVEIKECIKGKDLEEAKGSVFKWLAGIFATAFISLLAVVISLFISKPSP